MATTYKKTAKNTRQKQTIRRAAESLFRARLGQVAQHVMVLTTPKLYDVRAWLKAGIIDPAVTAITVVEIDPIRAIEIERNLRKLGFVRIHVHVGNLDTFKLSVAVAKFGKLDFIWADYVGWITGTKVRWGLDNLTLANLTVGAEVWITTCNNYWTQLHVAHKLHNLHKRNNPAIRAAFGKLGGIVGIVEGADCKGNADNAEVTAIGHAMMVAGVKTERSVSLAYADNKRKPMSFSCFKVVGRAGKSAFAGVAARFAA